MGAQRVPLRAGPLQGSRDAQALSMRLKEPVVTLPAPPISLRVLRIPVSLLVAWLHLADLPNSGIEPRSLALQADSLPIEPPGKLSPSPADLFNPGIELGSPALQVDSLSTELSGKPTLYV